MTDLELLAALKVDLGITSTGYDSRLTQLVASAKAAIAREGAVLDLANLEDCQIVIMYAGWLWRRRENMEGMPRMLRWALNNKVFSGKMAGGGA